MSVQRAKSLKSLKSLTVLRVSMFAALTAMMVVTGAAVARAQEGPVDHLRHRAHQIVYTTHRMLRPHRPTVVRVYVPSERRHYYRYRAYDRRHHRYYWTYRRY